MDEFGSNFVFDIDVCGDVKYSVVGVDEDFGELKDDIMVDFEVIDVFKSESIVDIDLF